MVLYVVEAQRNSPNWSVISIPAFSIVPTADLWNAGERVSGLCIDVSTHCKYGACTCMIQPDRDGP